MSHSFDDPCEWFEGSCELDLDDLQQHMLEHFMDARLVHMCYARLVHMCYATYSTKDLKLKLQERYGEHIYFAKICGCKNVVSLYVCMTCVPSSLPING